MTVLNREVLVKKYGKENLINLTKIEINMSQIRNIDLNTFKGLTKLEILDLGPNEIEDIDYRLFESVLNLKALYLWDNKLKEIDRKCFEPLKSIELIDIHGNIDLNAVSFINPSTKCGYNKDVVNKYGSISVWNKFLQQFPEIGNNNYSSIYSFTF